MVGKVNIIPVAEDVPASDAHTMSMEPSISIQLTVPMTLDTGRSIEHTKTILTDLS